jgi:4-alpha-glucanotransferase
LRFSTKPGQQLKILGNCIEFGNNVISDAVSMHFLNQDFWKVSVTISPETLNSGKDISYYYIFEDQHGAQIQDWGIHRIIKLNDLHDGLTAIDTWTDMGAVDNTFYTAPFTNVYQQSPTAAEQTKLISNKIRFKAIVPLLSKNAVIHLIGNTKELGSWNQSNAIPMKFDGHAWFADLALDFTTATIEYKYAVKYPHDDSITFEDGVNRKLRTSALNEDFLIIHDGYTRFNNSSWKGTGIAIPVFSLRSKKGLGVGEFTDINLLVDWAKSVSIKMVQLLPVNDTTRTHTYMDSYPYAAISAFALHPLYVNLESIAGKKHADKIKSIISSTETLNASKGVDYDAVMKLKWKGLSILFDACHNETFESVDYKAFFQQNKYWLVPYAAYSYLRDLYGSANPADWGKYAIFNNELIKELCDYYAASFSKIALHFFIQYHLHCQLKNAHDYANANGILLKGDIAIGVHRHGVDAWMQPELYNLDMQAGAPPDDFAVTGQNWGFPTYNWKTMKHDGYAWWQQRFKQMSYYFDAFRIDHILGFFRIWSIPDHAVEGIMGHFVPAIPVHRHEFEQKGIGFDADRLCTPYITDSVLWEMAQGREKEIKHFLLHYDGNYRFKPAFHSQRLVEKYFAELPETADNQSLKQLLFNLHSNVILWKEEDHHDHFHFRFNAAETLSYKHLDDHSKKHLWDLYVDYFFNRQDQIWKEEAMEKLPALKRSTEMLVCGEDLGLVPACLPGVMNSIGFLSMEVQRMPKQLDSSFFDPAKAPYLSVVTPSTHDMSTIREWWEEDRAQSQLFYNNQLGQYGAAPHFAEPHLVKSILLQHLWSPAMWSIFQLQDLFAMNEGLRLPLPSEERINVPGDSKHYWRFRMHINIEELSENEAFNNELSSYIKMSGRA